VGISLVAYVAYRIVGARAGAVLGGVFGGFISSTATTVSYARQCRGNPAAVGAASLVLVIASTVVLVRVAIEIAAVARGLLSAMMLPFGTLFVLMTAISAGLYWRLHHSKADAPVHG